ncbi:hypothetical protein EVAR_84559_1 [Eumeta japonica]|uniref:Uncharacterized protein n=1 Tax=Eumeta variegata TaxID=151549 RepID=A0A4C1UI50_EUMVA|nr:hypothetical protein EVAR_84559_1 [Eumeta japonica]
MPRVRVRKTSKGQSDLSRYKDAYEEAKAEDSPRKAADKRGINHCSLLKYLRKRNASSHYIQRADPEKSGFNAPIVNSWLTIIAQKLKNAVDERHRASDPLRRCTNEDSSRKHARCGQGGLSVAILSNVVLESQTAFGMRTGSRQMLKSKRELESKGRLGIDIGYISPMQSKRLLMRIKASSESVFTNQKKVADWIDGS